MYSERNTIVQGHIKTHTERSVDDIAAVTTLKNFFKGDGRLMPNFAEMDKWPNIDGTFEFVPTPDVSRRPEQNFVVQIKGTQNYTEKDGIVKYSLKSLAFPAFISNDVTLDPGILFVVLNASQRGKERVFWKYMSVEFIKSIDFTKNSTTIAFAKEDEIQNSAEGLEEFCKKLKKIVAHHSFVNKLEETEYTQDAVLKIIKSCDEQITESIERMELFGATRDNVSQRILNRLQDLCKAMLILNAMDAGYDHVNLQLAWEHSMLNIQTKYLGIFMRGLKYIGPRIPDDGQSERLMLKYYDFLWQIRQHLRATRNMVVLHNLEKFPRKIDPVDKQYYELIAEAIQTADMHTNPLSTSSYYVQKCVPFYVSADRYYEVTLQLAGLYATKYNRLTVYAKENISTGYPVKIGYTTEEINLWDISSDVKIVTNWRVSIDPKCLNKLAKMLCRPTKLNSQYGEYSALMEFLTRSGMSLLDLIDLQEIAFNDLLGNIYQDSNTHIFKDILILLHENYSQKSEKKGRNVLRYLLINLRADAMEDVLPETAYSKRLSDDLYISSDCYPFEQNPFISNLAGRKTAEGHLTEHLLRAAGPERIKVALPYLSLKNATKHTGEIYFQPTDIEGNVAIDRYNQSLDAWEQRNGYRIKREGDLVCIHHYEETTLYILRRLIALSRIGNPGQREYNQRYLKQSGIDFSDPLKEKALKEAFVDSQILLIYGAAGTGKTTLMNYLSNLMSGHKKLFISKTHTALQNLQRRIKNPGTDAEFISLNSFNKKVNLSTFDVVFVDECGIIDNRAMAQFLRKVNPNAFLVFAGDIHQIEPIEFGNWFYYAKEIINTHGANVELLSTWRTDDADLISLWDAVREKDSIITEQLAMDGPYSEDIGPAIFAQDKEEVDEVVLCLNYDGKFGLNNINQYFQNTNNSGPAISWYEWTYKVGDRILFSENKRFSVLYNNLKGRIADIEKGDSSITFTIDVDTVITSRDCAKEGIEFVTASDNSTRIRFSVYLYDENDEQESAQLKSIIPFQLAYAVSIHKAQGLEYDSVKIVIPSVNAEKITHGIFYTAITRTKKQLKIFWSPETMQDIVNSFYETESSKRSLEIIKEKISWQQN